MTTTTLSSKNRFRNLLKILLQRNLSTMAYLSVIIFLFFPLQFFLQWQKVHNTYQHYGNSLWWKFISPTHMYTATSLIAICFILIIGTLVISLSQISFVHQKRSVDLYHSLPLTRRQLMLANGIASFATVAVPFLINYFINIALAVGYSSFFPDYTFLWVNVFRDMLGWLVAIVGMIAIVFFVATQVGSQFENFIFSCEILITPFAILGIHEVICNWYLVGYSGKFDILKICNLTPATFMITANARPDYTTTTPAGWVSIMTWFLLGISLFVADMILYERRKSEKAESTGCQGLLGFVLVAIGTYIGAFLMGAFISSITTNTPINYLIGAVIGTILVYILIQVTLNRGFSGIFAHLRSGALICAVVILAQAIPTVAGGFGYETRMPKVESISSAEINTRGWFSGINVIDASSVSPKPVASPEYSSASPYPAYGYNYLRSVTLSNKESMAPVLNLHYSIFEESKKSGLHYGKQYSFKYAVNRHTMARKYALPALTFTSDALQRLWTCHEFVEKTHPIFQLSAENVSKIDLHGDLGFYRSSITNPEQLSQLIQALREDAIADRTQSYFSNAPLLCTVNIQTDISDPESARLYTAPEQNRVIGTFTLPVFTTDKAFIRTIKNLGLSDQLVPDDLSSVTAIGINNYYKGMGEQIIPCINDFMNLTPSNMYANEATLTSEQTIAKIAKFGTRFSLNNITAESEKVYCTFYKEDKAGITVQLPLDQFLNLLTPQETATMGSIFSYRIQ